MKTNDASLPITSISLNEVDWSFGFIDQVWIEYIEFVSLDNFWWRVIMIVVCLIVFVPLISCMHTVKVLWFPRSIFVMPPVNLHKGHIVK